MPSKTGLINPGSTLCTNSTFSRAGRFVLHFLQATSMLDTIIHLAPLQLLLQRGAGIIHDTLPLTSF